jgi:hypothetical protein
MKLTTKLTVAGFILGLFSAALAFTAECFIATVILSFLLKPFLGIVNIGPLTDRLSGLTFGQLFIVWFTIRFAVYVLIFRKPAKIGGGKES